MGVDGEGILQTSFRMLSIHFWVAVGGSLVGGIGTKASPMALAQGLAKKSVNIGHFILPVTSMGITQTNKATLNRAGFKMLK